MRLREINDLEEFSDLRATWNTVLEKSEANNIFLTWEWLWNWWKYFRRTSRLMILLAEEKNKIIGIAPLMYSVYRVFGLELRKVEFIGSSKHSDYGNFILTEKQTECLSLFMNFLENYPLKWDIIEFNGIPEKEKSLNSFRSKGNFYKFEERIYSMCPYVPLNSSFELFYRQLSAKLRRNLSRGLRNLRKRYKVEFTRHSQIDLLQSLIALHQKRQQAKGLHGVFTDPTFCSFLLDVSRCFIKNGWLDLSFITLDSVPIASGLSFEYGQKLYFYNQGFDPAYSKYSPGNILIMHLIEDCIRKGLREFDFLRGIEAYKNRWNTSIRKNIELIEVKGFVGNLYLRIKKSDNFIARKMKSMYEW